MIKSTDLRVGNLVSDESGVVFDITPTNIRQLHHDEKTPIFPIHITSDILDKLELIKIDKHEYVFNTYNIRKEKKLDNPSYEIYKLMGTSFWYIISIRYLHQLQNLYFALTGKELDYSLNSLTGGGSTFSKKTV